MFSTARTGKRAVRGAALAVGVVAALTLSACSGTGSNGSTGTKSDTLTVALTTPPSSIDPTAAGNGIPLVWYMNLAYEPLIKRDVDGTAKPGLATDWKYSTDRLSFTMNLRKGVEFSDGSALTADAVVASLQHYKAKGQFAAWLQNVSSISATGPLQVTLKLSTPDPLLVYGFDQGGIAGDIVAPAGLANGGKALGTETFGAGPYMLDKSATIANSSYVYVKNPHYYDKSQQHYKKVVLKVITDQNSILSAMRSGQVQVAQGSATNAAAAKQAGLNVTSAPSGMVGVYLADQEGKITPALKDVRVRQALNYAIDRKSITKTLYGDYGTPTDQYVPKEIPGYVASLEDQYPYDPAKAKALLKEAGYANGFSFTLLEQPGVDSGDQLAQAMVAQWKAIGVTVSLKTTPGFSDYVTAAFTKKYPASTLTFNYSVQLVDTQQLATNPAVYNFMGFTATQANALATAQRKYDVDSPEGKTAAEASETFMVQQGIGVPVASVGSVLFSDKSVTGVDYSPYPWPNPANWKPAN